MPLLCYVSAFVTDVEACGLYLAVVVSNNRWPQLKYMSSMWKGILSYLSHVYFTELKRKNYEINIMSHTAIIRGSSDSAATPNILQNNWRVWYWLGWGVGPDLGSSGNRISHGCQYTPGLSEVVTRPPERQVPVQLTLCHPQLFWFLLYRLWVKCCRSSTGGEMCLL